MVNARDTELLLSELCGRLGYCLPTDIQEAMQLAPPRGPETFTAAVLRAEGLNPEWDREQYRDVHALVAQAFDRVKRRDA